MAGGAFLARLAPHAHYASLLQYDTVGSSFVTDGTARGFYGIGDINRLHIHGRELYFAGNFQYITSGLQSNSVAKANLDTYIISAMDEGVWNAEYLPAAANAGGPTLASLFLQHWKNYLVVAGHISIPALGTGEEAYLGLYDTELGSWRSFPTEEGLCPEGITCQILGLAAEGEDLFVAVMHSAEESIFQTHLLCYNEAKGAWVEAGPVPTPGQEHDRGNVVRIAYDSLVATDGFVFALGYAADVNNPDPFANYAQFYTLSWSRSNFAAGPLYSELWLRVCPQGRRSMPAIIGWEADTVMVTHAHSTCQGRLGFKVYDGSLHEQAAEGEDGIPESLGSLESALFMVGDSMRDFVAVSDGTWTYAWKNGAWVEVAWGRSGTIRALALDVTQQTLYSSFTSGDVVLQQAVQKWDAAAQRGQGTPFFNDSVFKNGAVTSAVPQLNEGLLVGGDFRYAGTTPASIAAVWDGNNWQRTTQAATGFEAEVATVLDGDESFTFGLVFDKTATYTYGSTVPFVLWSPGGTWEFLPHRPTWTPHDHSSNCSPEAFSDVLYDSARQKVYYAGDFTLTFSGTTAKGLLVFDFVLLEWGTLGDVEFENVNALELVNNGMYLAIGGRFDVVIDGVSCSNLAVYDILNEHWVNNVIPFALTTEVLDLAAYPASTKVLVAGTLPSNNGKDYGVGVMDFLYGTWDLDGDLLAPVHSIVASSNGEIFAATGDDRPLKTQETLFHPWTELIPEAEGVYWNGHVSHLSLWCATAQPSPTPQPSRTAQPSRPASAGSSWEPVVESVYYYALQPGSSYWTNCTDPTINGTGHYYRCHVEGPLELSTMAYVGLALAAAGTVLFVAVVLLFVALRKKEETDDDDDDFVL